MQFLKKLQTKPRYVRVQILWISVILIMIIVFSFWVMHLNSSLGSGPQKTKAELEKQSVPSLFSSLKNDILLIKEKLKASVRNTTDSQEPTNKFEIEIIK